MTSGGGPGARTPSPNLRANGEAETRSVRVLMREAARLAAAYGYGLTSAEIRLLVRRYTASGAETDFRTWFIAYADPTGESAVRNVMRERNTDR